MSDYPIIVLKKRRAMSTERARWVKLAGHAAEGEFAALIDGFIYPGSKKKDIVDPHGNVHSVKGGDHKWQIFLYGRKRFETAIGFWGAKLFLACIDSFPASRNDYVANKDKFKIALQGNMRKLKNFLSGQSNDFIHSNKIIFLQEAIFHGSEVDYLTIKEGSVFHMFDAGEVINIIDAATTLSNSKASQQGQMDDQKVVFKSGDTTIGEIEMRNDSSAHYKQVKFWMDRKKTFKLLKDKINTKKQVSQRIVTYGIAAKRFKLKV